MKIKARMLMRVSTVGVAAGVAMAGALAIGDNTDSLLALVLAGAFIAVNSLGLTLPRGAKMRIDGGLATATALLLLPQAGALVSLAGNLAAAAWAQTAGRQATVRLVESARKSISVLAVSLVWARYTGAYPHMGPQDLAFLAAALAAGVGYMLLDLLGYAVSGSSADGAAEGTAAGLVRLVGGVYLGQVSVGVVLAVVYSPLGVLAVLVLTVLMVIMQHTFGLLLKVRQAYSMTVSALARVAELQSARTEGHSERVAALAAAMGRNLRLSSREMERLSLAALLHDIGDLGVETPEEFSDRASRGIAAAGAALVAQVSYLAGLAPVIARVPWDYSEYVDVADEDGRLARIIRVACDRDQFAGEWELGSVGGAGAAADSGRGPRKYDPAVLAALGQVAHRIGNT